MSYLTKEQSAILNRAKAHIRAINHPLRLKILLFIKANGNKMMVTSIYKKMRIEQSVASQHLAIMRRMNIVTTRRDGKAVIYSVNDAGIKKMLSTLAAL